MCEVLYEHRAKRLCPKELTAEVRERRQKKIDTMWVSMRKRREGEDPFLD